MEQTSKGLRRLVSEMFERQNKRPAFIASVAVEAGFLIGAVRNLPLRSADADAISV